MRDYNFFGSISDTKDSAWEDVNGEMTDEMKQVSKDIKETTGEDVIDVLGPNWEDNLDSHDCHKSPEDGCLCEESVNGTAGS